jgi:hypothetical protein
MTLSCSVVQQEQVKTSVTAALIGYLNELGKPYKISAPTGRAARILGRKAKTTTSTIHSMIYAPKADNETGTGHLQTEIRTQC